MAEEQTPTPEEATASDESASEAPAATEPVEDEETPSAPENAATDEAVDTSETPSDTDATSEDAPAAEDASSDDDEAPADEDATDETAAQEEADAQSQENESEDEPSHRVTIEQLLKAGTHFGHLTSRWNPRMEKHIFMERNNIHIIDLMQTQVMLDDAADAAKRFARRGKKILFAGTKKQAQEIVREYAEECGMPHMVQRWMGGTMTNFQTIRKSIRRMEEIERMEKDGTLDKLKKKEKLVRMREHEKLERDLGGIRHMANLPGALFVVDVKREDIAVKEARKLGIPIIAMVDTNGDPRDVDYPVPSNDDALSSIDLVTSTIADAIQEGLHERKMQHEANKKAQQTG